MEDIHLIDDEKTDSHGFVGFNPATNNIVIVFRGTIPWSITNIFKDFTFDLVKFGLCGDKCKIHDGFHQCYQGLRSQFWQAFNLMRAKYPNAEIQLTGHSLGAALATLFAADLSVNQEKNFTFYSFGSPRIGNTAWAKWFLSVFRGHYFRITHRRDPVIHMGTEFMTYKHIP